MKQFKKLVAAVLTLSLLMSGLYIVAPKLEEVKAAGSSTQGEGQIFAGYYVDKDFKIPSDVESEYPKYVDSGVLSVKMQVKKNETAGTYDMRVLSTVDSLNFKKVGFDVYFDGATEAINFETDAVLERISATSTVTYQYSPKVIDTDSEYFVTGTIKGITEGNIGKTFYIKPYWKTLDGTQVYGEARYFTVEDATAKTVINIPVKMDDPGKSVTGVTLAGATVEDSAVELLGYKDGYAHLNISVDDKTALKSASVVAVGEDKAVYRNLESTYTTYWNDDFNGYISQGDNTWHEVLKSLGETEFVIANAADLYGLRAVNQDQTVGETFYLVSDIELNDINKIDWATGNVKSGVEYTLTEWRPVYLRATLDGQMHKISGMHATNTSNTAMFNTTYAGSTVKNFFLMDSYFKGTGNCTGSIAGRLEGNMDTVYSSATVETTTTHSGGMIGQTWNVDVTINNCWFNGTLNVKSNTFGLCGGIVGENRCSVTTIENCLNTGKINVQACLDGGDRLNILVGGIAGQASNNAEASNDPGVFKIKYCMSVGEITATGGQGGCVGTILGIDNTTGQYTTFTNSYGATETSPYSYKNSETGQSAKATYYGTAGWETTLLNDDYWVAVEGGTPELISFREFSTKEKSDVSAIKKADTSWFDSNPKASEYTLYTEEELVGLMTIAGEYYNGNGLVTFSGQTIKLGADLVLNDGDASTWATSAPKRTYNPIIMRDWDTREFKGTFDGQGHTISGLYISRGDVSCNALFGTVGSDAVIKDFKLVNSYINGQTKNDASAIVARCRGNVTIQDVYTDAIVETSGQRIGGIVGFAYDGTSPVTIQNCQFAGKIYAKNAENTNSGGIIGSIDTLDVSTIGCLFEGELHVTASANDYRAGGMAGWIGAANLTIDNCLSAGLIDVPSGASLPHAASIIGRAATADKVTLTNSYGTMESGVPYTCYLGYNAAKTIGLISKTNLLSAGAYVFTTLSDTYWTPVKGSIPQLKKFQTIASADTTGIGKADTSWYTENTGATTYTLSTAEELYGLMQLSQTYNFAGKTIELDEALTEPIDMHKDAGVNGLPIGHYDVRFAGNFNGNGKTISGLSIIVDKSYAALFGVTAAGTTVGNFKLVESYIEGKEMVASVVGRAYGNVNSVYSDATLVATTGGCNGGIVGQAWDTAIEIRNCWYAGTIYVKGEAASHTGGILGENRATVATIDNCLYSGWIISNSIMYSPYIGGILGSIGAINNSAAGKAIISNCISTGDFSTKSEANKYVGAILGRSVSTETTVTNCFAQEEMWSHAFAPIGETDDAAAKAAGILPRASMINNQLTTLDQDVWAFIQDGTPELRSFMQGTEYVAQ